ncbi:MAG: PIG-L family deacetylase [Mycobacterium sp.]|uniref:PIG-L deacetylase family protein n=1 Tax=Mycobacterium sp. TaxID=1785 RepID=UPI001ED58C92|nr:PIG-L deacetylase family protein [Mycobacterium sp.]MBW0018448.1 PIG-L family deacetylase [Mycobacterium sp.]
MSNVLSNSARFAAMPLSGGGTPARVWLGAPALPRLDLTACPALVVVAPHPDDETLGLGATIAQLVASGVAVKVVCVSDGGAAGASASGLVAARRRELLGATKALGIAPPTFLGLPDGQLADHEDELIESLAAILDCEAPGTWCAATWRGDGHPDHEAVGRAAAHACVRTGIALVEYPVWMWHWATPADPAVPWERAYSVPVADWARERKHHAAQGFRSQLDGDSEGPVLPQFVLRRLLAVGEVVFR